MTISIVVASARNRVIGNENKLPWNIPADLKRFKSLTMGHSMVMGRKTFDSIGKVLPGRNSIIISRQTDLKIEGAHVVHNIEAAIACAKNLPGAEEIFIIGGAQIYELALPLVNKIYLTRIELEVKGDALFPFLPPETWKTIENKFYPATDNSPAFLFETLVRS